MSMQIIVLNGNIFDLRDNANSLRKNRNFLRDKPQRWQQHSGEKVNNNKDVRILVVKGRKITIIIISVKLIFGKLLMASTKIALVEDGQNGNISKI